MSTIRSDQLNVKTTGKILLDTFVNEEEHLVTNHWFDPAWDPPEMQAVGYLLSRPRYEEVVSANPELAPNTDDVRAITLATFRQQKMPMLEEVADGGIIHVVACGPAGVKPWSQGSDYLLGLDYTDTDQVQYAVVVVPVDYWEMVTGTTGAAARALGIGGDR